ncbi:L,D-transpeptidase [Alicyclobacillus tolerans]|uniref:Lipoprotein-anchoring transpeptidase ErfK/SrfK n=1 Tax=Alicyclobacillus tolerans TaxID=90970 RepID=A0ABT9LXW4_9BACL|nr:L,D-transpeptidase [Alicyclobacillus tengchongensis]MDP9729094.1 lipoprotein-anchoring transpeptidase ErfK/SrfK [Alicyclobacillus tengchongensis]
MKSRSIFSCVVAIWVALATYFGGGMLMAPRTRENLQVLPQITQFNVLKGISLHFNHRVQSLKWRIDGKTYQESLAVPQDTLWLKTSMQQHQFNQLTLLSAVDKEGQHLQHSVTIAGWTPKPLHVTTDPGIWQLEVSQDGPFWFHFSAPVKNPQSLQHDLSFQPAVAGNVEWKNSTTAEFIPNQPLPATERVVMLLRGGKHSIVSTTGQFLPVAQVVRPFVTATPLSIVVREGTPETLTVYQGQQAIFKTLCNTGVDNATPLGHFYIRFKSPVVNMKGVNPNGTHYDDPGVKWVMSFDGNIAIHGFPRPSYGFPQSAGCVELPVNIAKKLYSMVHIGTPVTIEA